MPACLSRRSGPVRRATLRLDWKRLETIEERSHRGTCATSVTHVCYDGYADRISEIIAWADERMIRSAGYTQVSMYRYLLLLGFEGDVDHTAKVSNCIQYSKQLYHLA